jgi:hypothetical protein
MSEYLFSYMLDSLTFGKILRHGADGFTSPPKEVVLRIFIALKNKKIRNGRQKSCNACYREI